MALAVVIPFLSLYCNHTVYNMDAEAIEGSNNLPLFLCKLPYVPLKTS